jgi:RecA-family ATPase
MALDANDIARDKGVDEVRRAFDEAPSISNSGSRKALPPHDWRSTVSTAAQLQHRTFPPVSYVVPDLIPEGLSILAGKPKIGKSWLALDICLAVSGNRHCLGDRYPNQGDVLYCALEDNERRLQRRISKLMGVFKGSWSARLTLATRWRRLDKGGVEDIAEWIDSVECARLIVLDTLAGVKPIRTTSGYVEDYESLSALHRLANDKGVAILVLHHTRKLEAEDPIDTISGTLGLSGCADTILVLARSSKGTTLYVRGRDIEEAEHAVEFQRETCRWTILGDAALVRRSEERQAIINALEGGEMAVKEIVAITGKPRTNIEKLLHSMGEDGEVVRVRRGVYALGPTLGKNGKKVRNTRKNGGGEPV